MTHVFITDMRTEYNRTYHKRMKCGETITCGISITEELAKQSFHPCELCFAPPSSSPTPHSSPERKGSASASVDVLADILADCKITQKPIGMNSQPIVMATHFGSRYKPGGGTDKPPLILVADTEGKRYISQISFMSLDDSVCIHRDLLVPALLSGTDIKTTLHHKPMTSTSSATLVTLQSVFDELNEQTSEHKDVYVLFQNGRKHDELLLKMVSEEEKFVIPEKYHFGDTLDLFKCWLKDTTKLELESLYLQVFQQQQPFTKDETYYKWHMAHFDTFQLRRIIRFLIMYMVESGRSKALYPSIQSVLSENRLCPEWPLSNQSIWVFWKWLETETTKLRTEKGTTYRFEWKTMQHVVVVVKRIPASSPTASSTATASPARLRRDPKQAIYVSSSSSARHYANCRFVAQYKSIQPSTDWTLLEKKPICQICASLSELPPMGALKPRNKRKTAKIAAAADPVEEQQVEGMPPRSAFSAFSKK